MYNKKLIKIMIEEIYLKRLYAIIIRNKFSKHTATKSSLSQQMARKYNHKINHFHKNGLETFHNYWLCS